MIKQMIFLKLKKYLKPALIVADVVVMLTLVTGIFYFSNNQVKQVINKGVSYFTTPAYTVDKPVTVAEPENEIKSSEESKNEDEIPAYAEITAPDYGGGFQWGVTMRPNAIGSYTQAYWNAQIDKAKELGVNYARVNWDYNVGNTFSYTDKIIGQLKDNGIEPYLIIEHNPRDGFSNLYQNGYDDGNSIASYYKGKINIYQMDNEVGAQAIKDPTFSGVNEWDFDDEKYQKIKEYVRGLSDGINAADPSATKVVTISWMHTGFLDKLENDDINYDMIGIDWYDWMGNFFTRKISNSRTLFQKLKSFGKPIVFAEINSLPKEDPETGQKTVVDEEYQANFIRTHAELSWENRRWIKGFYVLELVDNILIDPKYLEYYGLVKVTKPGQIGDPRQSFSVYQEVIRNTR